jgi:hypothetical protein
VKDLEAPACLCLDCCYHEAAAHVRCHQSSGLVTRSREDCISDGRCGTLSRARATGGGRPWMRRWAAVLSTLCIRLVPLYPSCLSVSVLSLCIRLVRLGDRDRDADKSGGGDGERNGTGDGRGGVQRRRVMGVEAAALCISPCPALLLSMSMCVDERVRRFSMSMCVATLLCSALINEHVRRYITLLCSYR